MGLCFFWSCVELQKNKNIIPEKKAVAFGGFCIERGGVGVIPRTQIHVIVCLHIFCCLVRL